MVEALGLSFKNSKELNRIINTKIPSVCAAFQHEEIVVASEAFDVYFQDIIQCIHALYGNPEFAQDLIFKPEWHYLDADHTTQVYSEINTAKWWWKTQVT